MKTITRIETSVGGPCIYKKAFFSDGSYSGRVRYTGQDIEKLKEELFDSAKTGRDDCEAFIGGIV